MSVDSGDAIGQPVAVPQPGPVVDAPAPVATDAPSEAAPADPSIAVPDAAPGDTSPNGDAVPSGDPTPVAPPADAPVGGSGHDLAWHVMLGTVEGYVGQMRATFHSALSIAVEHAKAIAAVDGQAIADLVAEERALFDSLGIHFK